MSTALQLIIILVAIAVFIVLTVKGFSSIAAGVIAAAIVSFIAIGGFTENLFTTFITGMTDMFGTFFILFSCGMAFGSLLAASGCSDSLGEAVINALGEKQFIWAILIVTVLFAFTGAPPLALMPALTFGILKRANLPRYIGMVAVAGCTAFALSSTPGTLGGANVIVAATLGTTPYVAPLLGILATVIGFLLLGFFCLWLIKDARKKGIGYDPVEGNELMDATVRPKEDRPHWSLGLIAIIVLLGGTAVEILAFGWDTLPSVLLATIVSSLIIVIFGYKHFHKSPFKVVGDGVLSIQANIICAITVCGFAAVISNTEFFQAVVNGLLNSSMSPYILAVIGTFIISAICADSIGGAAAAASTIGTALVEAGANAAVVHRLISITCGVFDSLPHAGSMILALTMFGYDHKSGYKYLIISNIAIPFIYTAICLIVALIAF